mmetsp:Transcript_10337/g.33371  ORF Transcript_10337/g.33371 Transcript_10337/m.33371 type:complete len:298 (-) Transcript_10337:234-1127(-)
MRLLTELQVVVLGCGNVGSEVIDLLRGVGCAVHGLFRSRDGRAGKELENQFTGEELPAYMRRADYIINCLPHTPTTDKMLGRAALGYCREGVAIISVGSPEVLDFPAIAEAMSSGTVCGLVVDTPQGEDLSLRSLPKGGGVVVTEGASARAGVSCAGCESTCNGCTGAERIAGVFIDNLRAFNWGAARVRGKLLRITFSLGFRPFPAMKWASSPQHARHHLAASAEGLGPPPLRRGASLPSPRPHRGGAGGRGRRDAENEPPPPPANLGELPSRLSTSLRNAFAPRMKYVVQVPVGY